MPLRSPFQSRSLASNGITYAVPPGKGIGSSITSGVKDIAGIFDQMGVNKVRGAQRGAYEANARESDAAALEHTANAEQQAAETARIARKDRDILEAAQGLDLTTPEGQRAFAARVAPYNYDVNGPQGAAATVMQPLATEVARGGTPFTRNALATFMAVNGNPLADNEALTADENTQRFATVDATKRADAEGRDAANRYGSDQQLRGTIYGADASAGASRYNTDADAKAAERKRYSETYMTSLGQIRAAGGDARLPGGGVPAAPATSPKTEKTTKYDTKGKPGRSEVKTTVPGVPNPNLPPGAPNRNRPSPTNANPDRTAYIQKNMAANPGYTAAEIGAEYDRKYGKK